MSLQLDPPRELSAEWSAELNALTLYIGNDAGARVCVLLRN